MKKRRERPTPEQLPKISMEELAFHNNRDEDPW